MKIGANTMIWSADFTTADLPLIDKVAAMGFDVIEILVTVAEPLFDPTELRRRITDAGLKCSVSASLSPEHDVSSEDGGIRNQGIAFLKSVIGTAEAIGANIVTGPLYARIGRLKYLPKETRARERERSIAALRDVARVAEDKDITLGIEVLNRFESDFLNLAADAVPFVEAIGSPAVGIHLDTFHMSIEERDAGAAIRCAGKHLKHMHMTENDRGAPGGGQVRWADVRQALRDVDYAGYLVIEAFNPELPELAEFVRVWRPVAVSQDALAADGLRFLRHLMA